MADEHIEHQIVILSATGLWSPTKLARHFGYTPAGMRGVLDRLSERIRERQELDAKNVILTHVKLADMLEQAVNAINAAILNPTHKENVSTARWLVERMAPTPSEQHRTSDVGAVLEGIGTLAMELVKSRQLTATVRLGNGEDAPDPHVTDDAEDAPYEAPAPTPPQLPEPNGHDDPEPG